jgi:hypothetical protein
MPVKIKIAFSVIVLAVAVAGYFFLEWLGHDFEKFLSLSLGVFCVVAFWIFPEVSHKKKDKQGK